MAITTATTFRYYADVKGINDQLVAEIDSNIARIDYVWTYATDALNNLTALGTKYNLYVQELTAEVAAMTAGGGIATYPEYDLWVLALAELTSFVAEFTELKAFIQSVVTTLSSVYPR